VKARRGWAARGAALLWGGVAAAAAAASCGQPVRVGGVAATMIPVGFPSFPDAAGLRLNGNAAVTDNVLRLVGDNRLGPQAGSAFLTQTFPVGAGTRFEIAFVFRIWGAGPLGDGLTFFWHDDARGSAALGGSGNALGYGGIAPSLAVELDILSNPGDPSDNHVAVIRDGIVDQHLASADPGFALAGGDPVHAWLTYDGPSRELQVWLATVDAQPAAPLLRHAVDLAQVVGERTFIGLSAAGGGITANHDILSLSVRYQP